MVPFPTLTLVRRGLTDRQENDRSFDRTTGADRNRENQQPPLSRRGAGGDEDESSARDGKAGAERSEKTGWRKTDEEGERGRDKDNGGRPLGGGGGTPWGRQVDDNRREGKF